MRIEKLEGGYIVQYDDHKTIANAEHIANFILHYMKDVAEQIEAKIRARMALTDGEHHSQF
jgi:hypothetical protein